MQAIRLGVLVAAVLSLTAAAPGARAQEPVRVGALFPLTGPTGVFGNQNLRGFEVAADMVNDRGGVKGRKVEVVRADAATPQAAISEVNRMITQNRVRVIAGSTTTAVAMPGSQEAERNGVFFWECCAIADELTSRGFKYTFRLGLNSAGLGLPAMRYAIDAVAPALNKKPSDLRVAMVGEESSFGIAIINKNAELAAKNGVKVVLREYYPAGSKNTDLTSLILKLRDLNPDVVIATAFLNDAILLGRQMKELRYVPKAYIGTSAGHSTSALAQALGADVNGTFSSSYPPDVNTGGLTDTARRDLEEFTRRFREKHKEAPAVQEVVGFVTGMTLFRDLMGSAAGVEPDQLRAAALALDMPVGSHINGWGIKFDATGQNERSFATMVQWQNQEMKVVSPSNFATARPVLLPNPAARP